MAVGTYCYVAVSTLQARSARRRKALRRPQREERGGGILWRARAYSLLVNIASARFAVEKLEMDILVPVR